MWKNAPAALLLVLLLSGMAPLAALEIRSPFRPLGPLDPALLLDPGQAPVLPMFFEAQLVDTAGEPVAGAEVILRLVYPAEEGLGEGEGQEDFTGEVAEELEGEVAAEGEGEVAAELEAAALEAQAAELEAQAAALEAETESHLEYWDSVPTRHTRSDAHGFFRMPDLDPRMWATLELSAPGYADASHELGWLKDGRLPHRFVLEGGGGLQLQVVDEKGEPLPAARVSFSGPGEGFNLGMHLLFDPLDESLIGPLGDGIFRLQGLAAGVSSLVVLAPRYRSKIVAVELPPGGRLDLGKQALEPAPRVRGRVLDPEGQPLAVATVQLQLVLEPELAPEYNSGAAVETDEKGRFELWQTLPEGFTFALLASHEGFGSVREVFAAAPRDPVELELAGRRRVDGQMVLQSDGSPVAECNVFTSLPGTDYTIQDYESADTDEAGFFVLEKAPAGAFNLNFSCGGQFQEVAVGEDAALPLRLEVKQGTFLRGRVIREVENPEESTILTFLGSVVGAEADGSFAFEGLDPGEGPLQVESGEASYLVPLVRLPPEGLEGLEVRAPRAESLRRLSGVVYDPWGRPAASAWVQIYSDSSILLSTTWTEVDGTFRSNLVEPGECTVVVQWQERYFETKMRLSASETPVELAFPPGATLRGQVDGFPAEESIRLYVRASRPGQSTTQTAIETLTAKIGAGGTFVFEQMPEGDWDLRAAIVGRRLVAAAQVHVESEGTEVVRLELAEPE